MHTPYLFLNYLKIDCSFCCSNTVLYFKKKNVSTLPFYFWQRCTEISTYVVIDLSNSASKFGRFCLMFARAMLSAIYNSWLLSSWCFLSFEVFLFSHISNFLIKFYLVHYIYNHQLFGYNSLHVFFYCFIFSLSVWFYLKNANKDVRAIKTMYIENPL